MLVINAPFQAVFLIRVRVFDADVILALAVDLKPGIAQGRKDAGTVGNVAGGNALLQVVANQRLGVRLNRKPCAQAGGIHQRLDAGLVRAGAGGIVGACPSVPVVVVVAQGVKGLFPSWRRNVQALAGRKVDAGIEDMDVHAAVVFSVQDGGKCVAIRFESSEGGALIVVQHFVNFFKRRGVFWCPCNDAGSIPMLKFQTISNLPN